MSEPTVPRGKHGEDEDLTRTDRRGLFHDTWELELLISGALVFGLLQVPGRISAWWDNVSLYLTGDLRFAHFLAYYYLTLIVYVLVGAFCLHIASRAYWVGLIGLRSVYPEGPDWDRLGKRGRFSAQLLRARSPGLDKAIRSADDFCSSIFAFASLVVGLLILSVVIAIPVGAIVWLLKATIWPEADALLLGLGIFYLTLAPLVLATLIDRRFGDRLDPDGWPAALVRGASGYGYWLSLGPLTSPITTILGSRVRARVVLPLFLGAILLVVVLFSVDAVGRNRTRLLFENFSLFPEGRTERTLTDAYYADRRAGRPGAGRLPYIQSDIVGDPYVRLFVPYYPNRDEELVKEICPELEPLSTGGLLADLEEPDPDALEDALTCLAARYEITLDGRPQPDLEWYFSRDPLTDARGTMAYLPVGELMAGRHELRLVRRLTGEQESEVRRELAEGGDPDLVDAGAVDGERVRHVIPFWR